MSDHADTIRRCIEWADEACMEQGWTGDFEITRPAATALDALLAEREELRKGIIRRAEQFSMDAADREHQRVHELEDRLAEVLAERQQLQAQLDGRADPVVEQLRRCEAERQQAIDALRKAPLPINATEHIGDDWDDLYEAWWEEKRRAALKLGEQP